MLEATGIDQVSDVKVVSLKGWLIAGIGVAEFQRIIAEHSNRHIRGLALGFRKIKFMDPAGFAALSKAWEDLGGKLVVFGVKELIKWKLEMAAQGVSASIRVFGSRDEAVNSFFPKRKGQLICMPSR